jgi:hypothetical protein
MAWLKKTENKEQDPPKRSVVGRQAGWRSPLAEQQWAVLHNVRNRLMHIIHGNSAAAACAAGGLFDLDDADLLDGEPVEEPESCRSWTSPSAGSSA